MALPRGNCCGKGGQAALQEGDFFAVCVVSGTPHPDLEGLTLNSVWNKWRECEQVLRNDHLSLSTLHLAWWDTCCTHLTCAVPPRHPFYHSFRHIPGGWQGDRPLVSARPLPSIDGSASITSTLCWKQRPQTPPVPPRALILASIPHRHATLLSLTGPRVRCERHHCGARRRSMWHFFF